MYPQDDSASRLKMPGCRMAVVHFCFRTREQRVKMSILTSAKIAQN